VIYTSETPTGTVKPVNHWKAPLCAFDNAFDGRIGADDAGTKRRGTPKHRLWHGFRFP
jgi:hypothetical protein